MSSDQPNPYAPPETDPMAQAVPMQGPVDQAVVKKIEAIVKDADQFWMAILLCFLCTGLGMIIIGPWYFVRLLQWNSMARAQPLLLDPNVPYGSLAKRFQSARTKLIIGMSFGAVIMLLAILVFATMSVAP